jgi:small subunit ribosomal protein S6
VERRYETICIIKPDLGDETIKGIIAKASDSLKGGGGQVNKVDEWGRRRLAYPIQKKNEGYYVLFDYLSSGDASKELERILKLNEDVVRYQTVRFEGNEPAPEESTGPEEAPEVQAAPEAAAGTDAAGVDESKEGGSNE